ncbi:hypothetical protein EON83_25520 [bacterium]|nr:MAG: hypothetical protein EON83_25520 [bacterium]
MKLTFCLLWIVSLQSVIQAQEVNRPRIKSGTYYNHITKAGVKVAIAYPKDWDGCPADEQVKFWWRNWRWDANEDLKYAKATREIDASLKGGVTSLALAKRYQKEVSNDMWNPMKNYRWAYAAWLARKKPKTKQESDTILFPVIEQFEQVKFPGSYHYARIGFLANVYKQASPCLKRLGDRLLNKNPNDEDVKFYMIRVLANTFRPEDDKRALNYLESFRRQYPKNTYYVREAANLRRRFFNRQYPLDQKKADAAVTAFQDYIKVAPTSYEKRWAAAMIDDIKYNMNYWNRWGRKYWLSQHKAKG